MGYCCLEMKKIKTMGNLQKCFEHNFREANTTFPHVESKDTVLNHELVGHPPVTYGDLLNKRFNDVEMITGKPIKKRKDAVLAFEIVLTFSHSETENLDINKWEEENLKWLKKQFGEENVLSAIVHMDETTPHIHAIVTPITDDNRLCAKDFTGGKAKMFKLQDSYGNAMKQFGLDRGLKNSRATKRQLKKFYGLVADAFNQTLPKREQHESEDDYYERVQEFLTNRELKNKSDVLSMERQRDESRTAFWNFRRKYKKAIKLYDKIAEKLGFDEDLINTEFNTLLSIEDGIGTEKLHHFFSMLQLQTKTYNEVSVPNAIAKAQENKLNKDIEENEQI